MSTTTITRQADLQSGVADLGRHQQQASPTTVSGAEPKPAMGTGTTSKHAQDADVDDKPGKTGNRAQRDERTCYNCGKVGHTKRTCQGTGPSGHKHGTRSRGKGALVAESLTVDVDKAKAAADNANEEKKLLLEELQELKAKPALRDVPKDKDLLGCSQLEIDGFQTYPYRRTNGWVPGFGWILSLILATDYVLLQCLAENFTFGHELPGSSPYVFGICVLLVVLGSAGCINSLWRVWSTHSRVGSRYYRGGVSVLQGYEDSRGPLNRQQKMFYSNSMYRQWVREMDVPRKFWAMEWSEIITAITIGYRGTQKTKRRIMVVSEVLVQILLSPGVALHVEQPEYIYEKMVMIAGSQSWVNVGLIPQAAENVAAGSVDVAYSYLYGFRLNSTETTVPHFSRDVDFVRPPARY